ncbi:hypothetical protein A2U01_0054484, partial [Trifolium medium]|nr:hypothetical protein [Trifolium medium]
MAATTWHMKGFEDLATTGDFAMHETMKLAADCCFSFVVFDLNFFNLIRVLKKGIEQPCFIGK